MNNNCGCKENNSEKNNSEENNLDNINYFHHQKEKLIDYCNKCNIKCKNECIIHNSNCTLKSFTPISLNYKNIKHYNFRDIHQIFAVFFILIIQILMELMKI